MRDEQRMGKYWNERIQFYFCVSVCKSVQLSNDWKKNTIPSERYKLQDSLPLVLLQNFVNFFIVKTTFTSNIASLSQFFSQLFYSSGDI